MGESIANLPALRRIGFAASRRLLEVEKVTHDCILAEETFRRINQPLEVRQQAFALPGHSAIDTPLKRCCDNLE